MNLLYINISNINDISLFPKLLTHNNTYHSLILTDIKIKWIIVQKSRGRLSMSQIALLQRVSESRVRQLWSEYRKTRRVPTLKKAGRPRRVLTESEEREIISVYMKYPTNEVAVECILKKRDKSLAQPFTPY